MGKASKFKKLRKMASQLPDINTRQVKGGYEERGSELLKQGFKEIGGLPVDPDKVYVGKRLIEVPLNHNRKMKQAYQKFGMGGAIQYANTVVDFVNRQQPK